MKDVPNLKIGIVAYSSIAAINPNSKSGTKKVKSLDSNSSHDLQIIIHLEQISCKAMIQD